MRKIRKALLLLFVLTVGCATLTGCWDEVDLSDQGYVSALGIDLVEGQYVIYAQLIQFSAIAKTREPGTTTNSIWVGQGKGRTLIYALGNLQQTSQFSINLEHMKVLIIHKRALGRIEDILDANNRQRASRYTSLVFATGEPLLDLFNTGTFFGRSPLLSIMYNPGIQYEQSSLFRPMTMQQFVQKMFEPASTALLPSIKIDSASWHESKSSMDVQTYEGVVPYYNKKPGSFMSVQELDGYRWIDPKFNQYYVYAGDEERGGDGNGNGLATVNIKDSKPRVRLLRGGDRPKFRLEVKLRGHLVELAGHMTETEIKRDIERKIKANIEQTYRIGCEKKVDIMELEEHLYRDHNRLWKRIRANGGLSPEPDQLEVKVEFNLAHSGKFDLS